MILLITNRPSSAHRVSVTFKKVASAVYRALQGMPAQYARPLKFIRGAFVALQSTHAFNRLITGNIVGPGAA